MLNLIIFGPPGSGKGTQSNFISEKYKLTHVSTGDLLRSEIANETALGLEAQKLMKEGLLVPDEVVIGMIKNKLENKSDDIQGFIFDGFPRTVAQAEALDNLLMEINDSVSGVVALGVPEEELVKRLLLRGVTSNRPDDQDEEIIRQRVLEYETKTAPVASYYDAKELFSKVDGVGSIEEIFDNLCVEINGIQASVSRNEES